jgi:hypothetical protein
MSDENDRSVLRLNGAFHEGDIVRQ